LWVDLEIDHHLWYQRKPFYHLNVAGIITMTLVQRKINLLIHMLAEGLERFPLEKKFKEDVLLNNKA
jgi:hypothetical protein